MPIKKRDRKSEKVNITRKLSHSDLTLCFNTHKQIVHTGNQTNGLFTLKLLPTLAFIPDPKQKIVIISRFHWPFWALLKPIRCQPTHGALHICRSSAAHA